METKRFNTPHRRPQRNWPPAQSTCPRVERRDVAGQGVPNFYPARVGLPAPCLFSLRIRRGEMRASGALSLAGNPDVQLEHGGPLLAELRIRHP